MTTRQGELRSVYPAMDESFRFSIEESGGSLTFTLEDSDAGSETAVTLGIESRQTGEGICRTETGQTHAFAWAWVGPELHLWVDGSLLVFQRVTARRRGGAGAGDEAGDILAPMPGAVLEVLVSEGDRVERNQTVVLMESMKMELVITAPRDGIVRRVSVEAGQQVDRGMRLLELAPDAGSAA